MRKVQTIATTKHNGSDRLTIVILHPFMSTARKHDYSGVSS